MKHCSQDQEAPSPKWKLFVGNNNDNNNNNNNNTLLATLALSFTWPGLNSNLLWLMRADGVYRCKINITDQLADCILVWPFSILFPQLAFYCDCTTTLKSWVKQHPQENQDPGFLPKHYNVIHPICHWVKCWGWPIYFPSLCNRYHHSARQSQKLPWGITDN